MIEQMLKALLEICGNGVRRGVEDWQRITEILVRLETQLIGEAGVGGRYGASVLAIQWARKAAQNLNRGQMLKALDYAIEQLQAKTAADLHTLNLSVISSDPICRSYALSISPDRLTTDLRKPPQSESHPKTRLMLIPKSSSV
jgi:hypothetical protein